MSAIASEAHIRIVYDGEALESGSMDVRDLAPALLALSDLFDETNKVLNGPDKAVQLRIKSGIKRGSFDVEFQVLQTWASKVMSLFAGDNASSAANMIEILGFVVSTGYGLFRLIKWLRGRPIKSVEILDDGRVRMVVEGDDIIITHSLAKVFNDVAVRRALYGALMPLSRDGIRAFRIKTPDGKVTEEITAAELPVFVPPQPAEMAPRQIVTNEFEKAYTLVSVTFKEGNKWRVSDGESTINVTIEDTAFLGKVDARDVSFVKDDVIRCHVRQEQSIVDGSLRTEFFVQRILEHQHQHRQVVLPFEPPQTPPKVKSLGAKPVDTEPPQPRPKGKKRGSRTGQSAPSPKKPVPSAKR